MSTIKPEHREAAHKFVLAAMNKYNAIYPTEPFFDGLAQLLADTEQAARASKDLEAINERNDLINHMRVHSGYLNCGYNQMTTAQKTLYDAIWADEVAMMNAETLESAARQEKGEG